MKILNIFHRFLRSFPTVQWYFWCSNSNGFSWKTLKKTCVFDIQFRGRSLPRNWIYSAQNLISLLRKNIKITIIFYSFSRSFPTVQWYFLCSKAYGFSWKTLKKHAFFRFTFEVVPYRAMNFYGAQNLISLFGKNMQILIIFHPYSSSFPTVQWYFLVFKI